jgi:hypothetical protein
MLKLTVAVLSAALAGNAAAGWRDLRVDASSEAAFEDSVALFRAKLSPSREHAFSRALVDIWREGTAKASAEQREYTSSDYLRQLDGLTYAEVVKIPDATGHQAKQYRAEYYRARAGRPPPSMSSSLTYHDASAAYWTLFGGGGEGRPRGSPSLGGVPGQ